MQIRAADIARAQALPAEIGAERVKGGRFGEAREIFLRVATESPLIEFLTLPAYQALRSLEKE